MGSTRLNKKLFLVTGVPRSGTTFFTHVLNENPEILCGMERFHGPQLSPSRLTIEGFKEYDLERASAQNHLPIVAKKASEKLKAIGDKCPRSYLHLERIEDTFSRQDESLDIIAILRPIRDVEHSWYTRANNKDDNSWDRGQYGVFPYIEMMILVWRLVSLREPERCLIISYESFISSSDRHLVLSSLCDFLTLNSSAEMNSMMERSYKETTDIINKERAPHPNEFKTSSAFFDNVIKIVNSLKVGNLSNIVEPLNVEFDALLADEVFFNEVKSYLKAVSCSDIAEYARKINKHYYNSLVDFTPKFASELKSIVEEAGESAVLCERFYDFTDLVGFYLHAGVITGIQRVQLEALRAVAMTEKSAHQLSALYYDSQYGYVVVSLHEFVLLFKEDNALTQRLNTFKLSIATRPTASFSANSVIYFLGATWGIPGLYSELKRLKNEGVRLVFYMHDLLPLQSPEFFEDTHCYSIKHWLLNCLAVADGLICNSEETKQAVLSHTNYKNSVTVADLNIRPAFLSQDTQQLDVDYIEQVGLKPQGFVIMVGTIEPRKNHLTALHVWQTLSQRLGTSCPKLVIVGKTGWMASAKAVTQIIEAEGTRFNVVHLQNVSDSQLKALYENCLFSLYLSRCEGWGLPVTESLAAGAVCVVGKNSSAKEAKQSLTITVDERSESEILNTISNLISDKAWLLENKNRVAEKAKFKSWRVFSKELISIEASLVNSMQNLSGWPVLSTGKPFFFGANQNIDLKKHQLIGLELLDGLGWNLPDEWGCWSNSNNACLKFVLAHSGTYSFYGAITLSDIHSQTSAKVIVNENVAWQGNVYPGKRTLFKGTIELEKASQMIDMQLCVNNVLNLADVAESPDSRRLGVGLIELCVFPITEEKERLEYLEQLIDKYITY